MPYRSQYAPKIADLLLQQGEDRARAEAASGQRWGSAVAQIGQQVSGALGQIAQERRDAPRRAYETARLAEDQAALQRSQRLRTALAAVPIDPATGRPDPQKLAAIAQGIDPVAAAPMWSAAETTRARQRAEQVNVVSNWLGEIATQPDLDAQNAAYQRGRAALIAAKVLTPQDAPEFFPGLGWVKGRAFGLGMETKRIEQLFPEAKTREVKTRNADGSESVQIVEDKAGQTFQSAAPLKPPATVGSFEDYLGRAYPGQTLTPDQILDARRKYNQADDRPPVVRIDTSGTDVKDTIAGMRDGSLPPLLPGRASREYVALLGEAKRQGFDLAGAATDWQATQKHIATLNGAQQLRLNQAVNALPEMLDSVEALAKQWKGGRFPLLNKANLAAAKAGAYGQNAASIANQLDAQIADVTADLGNVYMGGNSPTDHALELAGKSLKGEWSEQVLLDMVKLARNNVTIRRNSIRNVGVAGASENNPYAPPAPTMKADPLGIR